MILKKLAALFIVFLFLTGCAAQPPSGPNTVSPSPAAETIEPAPDTTVEPQASATPDPNAGREHITTPVLVKGLLVGGLDRGAWMNYDAFYQSGIVDFDGYLYDVYLDDAYVGEATGGPPLSFLTGEPLGPGEDINDMADVHLYDANQQRVVYDIALQGNWELFPRRYAEQAADQAEYLALAKTLLAQKGLENPDTTLKQVIAVDLDGDGTDEALIAADNTVDGQFEQIKAGDNALLVFRRIVDGQPADQIVGSYIVTKDPDYITPYRLLFAVETCADLDGDGTLEVIVKSWHYEGVTYSVYKLAGDQLELVASNGVGF